MEVTIYNEDFQNWMKCVSAQHETRKALCEVVEIRWKRYISRLTEIERGQITTFLECVKCKRIKYLKKDQQPFCKHLKCATLLQKLLKLVQDTSLPGKGQSTYVSDKDRLTSVSDKERSISVPDKDRLTSFPDKDRLTSVSDKDHPSSVPDKDRLTSVPDKNYSTSVPDKVRLTSVPDKDRSTSVQDKERPSSVPDKDRLTSVPDTYRLTFVHDKDRSSSFLDKDRPTSVPDKNSSTSVSDKVRSTFVQDKGCSISVQDYDLSTSVQDKDRLIYVRDKDHSTSFRDKDHTTSVPDKDHFTPAPHKEYLSNFSYSDPCYDVYWDFAKLYLIVEDDFAANGGLKGLDVCHLLKMMIACQLFAFEGSTEAFKSICEDRKLLFHTSDYIISDVIKHSILEHMSNVLSHFNDEEFYTCTDVKEVIEENQNKDWTKEYKFEYKRIARQMLELKIAALEVDLQEHKPFEEILAKTRTNLDEVIDIISKEESKDQQNEIVELENLTEESWLQKEDKQEPLCKATPESGISDGSLQSESTSQDSDECSDNDSDMSSIGVDPVEYMVKVFLPYMKHQIAVKDIIDNLHFLGKRDADLILSKHAFCASDAFELLIQNIKKSRAEGKWQTFLDALEEKGYKHIKLLLENKTEVHHKHSDLLKLVSPELERRIYFTEFMDRAYQKGLVTKEDKVKAKAQQREHGDHAGTKVILQNIDKRKKDWNTTLIEIFEDENFKLADIAELFRMFEKNDLHLPSKGTAKLIRTKPNTKEKVEEWRSRNTHVTRSTSYLAEKSKQHQKTFDKQDEICLGFTNKEDNSSEVRGSSIVKGNPSDREEKKRKREIQKLHKMVEKMLENT